jgi:5-formyltetrahydrofolate cyclo-ligase
LNEKNALRARFKEVLKNLGVERRFFVKEAVYEALKTETEPFQKVLSFASLKDEVDLSLFNQFLVSEKKLHLPFVAKNEIESKVAYDCIIVPGLAYNKNGYRLGRGGGHYDKLLAKYPNVYTIGVCFKEQLCEENLFIEPHDRPVKKVCAF